MYIEREVTPVVIFGLCDHFNGSNKTGQVCVCVCVYCHHTVQVIENTNIERVLIRMSTVPGATAVRTILAGMYCSTPCVLILRVVQNPQTL